MAYHNDLICNFYVLFLKQLCTVYDDLSSTLYCVLLVSLFSLSVLEIMSRFSDFVCLNCFHRDSARIGTEQPESKNSQSPWNLKAA